MGTSRSRCRCEFDICRAIDFIAALLRSSGDFVSEKSKGGSRIWGTPDFCSAGFACVRVVVAEVTGLGVLELCAEIDVAACALLVLRNGVCVADVARADRLLLSSRLFSPGVLFS